MCNERSNQEGISPKFAESAQEERVPSVLKASFPVDSREHIALIEADARANADGKGFQHLQSLLHG